jgi:rare lipoprotein A
MNIIGGFPQTGTGKHYRLQVGAYKVPRNAVDTFERLKEAGLTPLYEVYGDTYRVVLANLNPEDIPSIAEKLYYAGFREVLLREER